MAKKPILFPVDKFNGSIPHWMNFSQADSVYYLETITKELEELDAGYNYKSKPHYDSEDQWRAPRLLNKIQYYTRHEWKEAKPFHATLKIVGYSKGRSAANFDLQSVHNTETTYTVFMVDTIDIITKNTLVNGELTGYWLPVKRGANYGIKFLGTTI